MEVGARYISILQGLLASCRLHGIDPYVYFAGGFQRVDTHSTFEVHVLVPRLWQQHGAEHYLRSGLDSFLQ
jgi:transposase